MTGQQGGAPGQPGGNSPQDQESTQVGMPVPPATAGYTQQPPQQPAQQPPQQPAQPPVYGQGPGTLDHLGNIMTYFWYDPRADDPVLGVFLSQRLANAVVNNNMIDGLRVIFRVFVPLVGQALGAAATAAEP